MEKDNPVTVFIDLSNEKERKRKYDELLRTWTTHRGEEEEVQNVW